MPPFAECGARRRSDAVGLRPIKKQLEYSRELGFVAGAVPGALLNPAVQPTWPLSKVSGIDVYGDLGECDVLEFRSL